MKQMPLGDPQQRQRAQRNRPGQCATPARPPRQRAADAQGRAALRHAPAIKPGEPTDHREHGGSQPHHREQRHLPEPRKRRSAQGNVGNRACAQRQPQRRQQATHQPVRRALRRTLARREIVNAIVLGHAHQACAEHQGEQVHLAEHHVRHAERHRAAHQQRQPHQQHRSQ
ncbi:hypothetical protein SDC9_162123 [bioreactor metagenome]|uniref:Uncharacterized protein n=1 Tax=bioreactor metagenome TaxID=1076179 RepID=A0A645FRG8_9ZZZZ